MTASAVGAPHLSFRASARNLANQHDAPSTRRRAAGPGPLRREDKRGANGLRRFRQLRRFNWGNKRLTNNGHGLGHTHSHQYTGDVPLHDHYGPEAKYAVEAEASCRRRSGRKRSPAAWSWACRAPTRSRTSASRPSAAVSCRTSPASTRSSRRRTSKTCARRRVRRGRARRPVRRRHDVPHRHALRAAGHPQDLRAVRPVQLRARRRPARVDHDGRPRRHLHHPGQHREDLRPDLEGRRARLRDRRLPHRAGRRPLHRLSDRARRGAAPDAASSASSTSTGTSTRRRPTSTSGCTPRRGSTPPTSPTCRRRIWCRSASAAGRRPGPASRSGASAARPS